MKSNLFFIALFVGLFVGGFVADVKAQRGSNSIIGAGSIREARAQQGPDLVELAIAANTEGDYAGQFDTLIAAVQAADPAVINTLSGKGQFTVFAPTDDAFALLGLNPDNIDTLDQETLTQILLYHAARGRRDSTQVVSSDQIRSLQGTFFFPNNSTTITDAVGRQANIIAVDLAASNGIIHVIDAVILPFNP